MTNALSDEALSKRIAEFLEPYASLKDTREAQREAGWPKYWRDVEDNPHSFIRSGWDWQPRSMVSDPAMTVMLWKKLILVDGDWWIQAKGWKPDIDQLGRAVALAFAASHGLLEGE